MDALPAQWIEEALARAGAEEAEVRPFIAAPRPLQPVCFLPAEGPEEQQDDGHPSGTRLATLINTFRAATSSSSFSSTATSIGDQSVVIVAGTFHAALPQPEVGEYVSNDIIEGLKPVPKTERWIPPNARPRRRPL